MYKWICALVLISLPAMADVDKKVERLWKAKCASCHGADGKGQTETGKTMGMGDMTNAAFFKDLTDEKIRATISEGFNRTKNGKQKEMKAFKESLEAEQIDGLVAWVKSL